MKLKMYRFKVDKGYIHGSCLQHTHDRYKALCSLEKAQCNEKIVGDGKIEMVELEAVPCKVGDISFGLGDTYSLTSVSGAIIHQTKKYIYTVKLNQNGDPISGSVEKHKATDINTRCFKTGKGFTNL